MNFLVELVHLTVVNSISGVSISTITSGITSFSDVVFYSSGSSVVGVATTAHGFKNATYINISGISTIRTFFFRGIL